MASESELQMLPTRSSLRKKNPVRKGSIRYTAKPPSGLPEFEMLAPSGKSNGFIIQISEGRPSVSESVQTITGPQATRLPTHRRPQPPPLTIPQKAHVAQERRPATPPSPLNPSPTKERAPSAADIPLPSSSAPTPTFAGDGRVVSPNAETPMMRSIFPRYDASRPLARQSYYPDIEAVPGLASAMAAAGSSSINRSSNNPYRRQMARRSISTAKASSESQRPATAEVRESPLRIMENMEQQASHSRPDDLVGLWNIANGQSAGEAAADTYSLELSCDDLTFGREIITFNSSTSAPVYTLEASHSTIAVSRIHPSQRNLTIQTSGSVLSIPTAIDPLVTCIFPKLAGLMALDQSSSVAVAHKLDRTASADLQNEAIARAQEHEASMLLWDDASNRYCLMHPTLLDQTATTLPIEIVPTPSNPNKISILAPETQTPLLTLSLQSLTLTLHTNAITALPSLYILDTLMTTLLTLLLHLHRSCGRPSVQSIQSAPTTPMFPPPPRLAHKDSKSSLRSQLHGSTSRPSVFRSTKSVKSARSLHSASAYEQDIEMQSLHAVPATGEVAVGAKHQSPKQIFSTDDESLPKTTRAVLKLLYWVFELVFWIMGAIVHVLAAGVVGAGKLITKL